MAMPDRREGLSSLFRREKERPEPPEFEFYDQAKAIQRAWYVVQGGPRNVIDFDLTGGNHSERILYDLLKNEPFKYQMTIIIDRLEETLKSGKEIDPASVRDSHLHEVAIGQTSAMVWFAKRQRGDDLDKSEFIENTMQVPLVEASGEMIDDQLDTIHKLATEIGADLSESGFQQWRKEHEVDSDTAERQLYVAGLNMHRDKLVFIGEREKTLPVVIRPVKEPAYFYAWSDTNKQTGGFEVRQNFGNDSRLKTWTQGKSEELGPHELCQHCGRMLKRKGQIEAGKLHPFFGQTTTHGPEQTVEEGLAMTIAFFVPGAYEKLSAEGKMQIQMTLLKHLELGNAQLRLIKDPGLDIPTAAKQVKEVLTWESIEEIITYLEERTNNPLLEAYMRGYTEGARRHIIYSKILSPRGSQQYLKEVDEKPYIADQEARLVDGIAASDKKNMQSDIPQWVLNEFNDIVVSSRKLSV
jgi:hypothetical protein